MNVGVSLSPKRPESFRASCDNCAKSKVRCGKQQPRCQRCTQRGTLCGYSLSQRSRKRPMYVAIPDQQNTTGLRGRRSSNTISSTEDSVASLETVAGICVDLDDLTNRGDPNTLRSDVTGFSWLTDPMTSSLSKDLGMTEMLRLDRDEAISIGGTPSGFDSGGAAMSEGYSSPGSAQHCSVLLLSALEELGLPSESCTGISGASKSLGTVLKASRSALDSALNVASCACNPNSNVALLITTVAYRILCWYDAIIQSGAGCTSDGSATATDIEETYDQPNRVTAYPKVGGRASPSRDTAGKVQVQPVGARVFVPPITIGAYELDAGDQARMIVHIVLSELSKMNRLLDGFSKRFCHKGPTSLAEDTTSHLHVALEMFLRNKHSLTIAFAREKLDIK